MFHDNVFGFRADLYAAWHDLQGTLEIGGYLGLQLRTGLLRVCVELRPRLRSRSMVGRPAGRLVRRVPRCLEQGVVDTICIGVRSLSGAARTSRHLRIGVVNTRITIQDLVDALRGAGILGSFAILPCLRRRRAL